MPDANPAPEPAADSTSDSASAAPSDQERPTYEQARDELVQIVSRLEAGGIPLDESLALWRRGEELATLCEEYLDGARATLDSAVATRDSGDSAEDGSSRS